MSPTHTFSSGYGVARKAAVVVLSNHTCRPLSMVGHPSDLGLAHLSLDRATIGHEDGYGEGNHKERLCDSSSYPLSYPSGK